MVQSIQLVLALETERVAANLGKEDLDPKKSQLCTPLSFMSARTRGGGWRELATPWRKALFWPWTRLLPFWEVLVLTSGPLKSSSGELHELVEQSGQFRRCFNKISNNCCVSFLKQAGGCKIRAPANTRIHFHSGWKGTQKDTMAPLSPGTQVF